MEKIGTTPDTIPDCRREDRYWWPRCFGITLLMAADYDLDVGDEPAIDITPDVVQVCEVYTQHGDEIASLLSEDALSSLARLIADDINADAASARSGVEIDHAASAAEARATDRRAARAESLRMAGGAR